MMPIVERMMSVLLTLVHDTELSRYWTSADERYLRSRCEAEGLTFLTVTLPRLDKMLTESFRTGKFSPVEGFACERNKTYPRFLCNAWEALSGRELWNVTTETWESVLSDELRLNMDTPYLVPKELTHDLAGAVRLIRQVALSYYKTKLPYTKEQEDQVKQAFIAAELDLERLDAKQYLTDGIYSCDDAWRLPQRRDDFGQVECSVDALLTRAGRVVKMLLHRSDPTNIIPRHGSGASACRTNPWERYKLPRFIPKLHAVYPYDEWFYLSHGVDASSDESLDSLVRVDRPMARVVYVPKDSRGPRLISAEPREFMFIQQGLMTLLYETIDKYPMVKAQLDCRDQARNKRLARWGSETGAIATLDMKEASDRVSHALVKRLFPREWVRCFDACRSEGTVFPDGTEVLFRKFAPMGSAVCFPVEAICFWAIAIAAMKLTDAETANLFAMTPTDLESNQLAVFGDDIIVPIRHVANVVGALEACGLVVNKHKSYSCGPFRESCGGDFFLGEDVTPVRCREVPEDVWVDDAIFDRIRFRTCDWFNNLIVRYGTYSLAEPLYQLFKSWYGEVVVNDRVIPPSDEFSLETIPSRGLFLLGHFRQIPGWQLVRRRSRKGRKIPQGESKSNSYVGVRTKFCQRFHKALVYTLYEAPVNQKINTDDWSHLFRILLNGSGRDAADTWTLAKRCQYKYGWIAL